MAEQRAPEAAVQLFNRIQAFAAQTQQQLHHPAAPAPGPANGPPSPQDQHVVVDVGDEDPPETARLVNEVERPARPAAAPPAGGNNHATPAAATTAPNFTFTPEVIVGLASISVFVFLLIAAQLVQHWLPMLVLVYMVIAALKSEDAYLGLLKQEVRSRGALLGVLVVSVLTLVVYRHLSEAPLWNMLALQTAGPQDLLPTLWQVVINDSLYSLMCTAFKSFLVGMLFASLPPSTLTPYLDLLTTSLYIYRILLPIPLWVSYFMHIDGAPRALTYIFPSLYLLPKLGAIALLLATAFKLTQRMYSGDLGFGIRVPVPTNGDTLCSICHDTLQGPVQLTCKHLFCEQCISQWLAKEKTCPMCRATLPNAAPMRAIPSLTIIWH